MKILLLNQFDSGSGAATAVQHLTKALIENGIDAVLGVVNKRDNDSYVVNIKKRNIKIKQSVFNLLSRIIPHLFKTTFSVPHSMNLYSEADIDYINNSDCDVVHLHWCGANMIAIKDLAKINKPIVWTMHDCWACCGAESWPNIFENDKRYQTGYYRCNKPKYIKGLDFYRIIYKQKEKNYNKIKKIRLIAPSNWICNVMNESKLLGNIPCETIHNLIDKSIFHTLVDKDAIKQNFNIPNDKIVIGFGAAYDINNPHSIKGGKYLIEALSQLENKEHYLFVVFGPANENFGKGLGITVHNFGFINSQEKLAQIYNICDVFVCPSVLENLPYTCLESICCGTPVAAFRTGGIPDIIEHQYNGYLAEPFDSSDLAAGIKYVIENREILSRNGLEKVKRDFDTDDIVKKHIEVYKSILS